MKPTSQIRHNQHAGFPLTDYNFQATVDAKSGSAAILPEKKLRAFHKLSSDFFGAEAYRDYLTEFSIFTVIALATTWPIISMLVAVTRLVRNY
jgi:hypothetical protein